MHNQERLIKLADWLWETQDAPGVRRPEERHEIETDLRMNILFSNDKAAEGYCNVFASSRAMESFLFLHIESVKLSIGEGTVRNPLYPYKGQLTQMTIHNFTLILEHATIV